MNIQQLTVVSFAFTDSELGAVSTVDKETVYDWIAQDSDLGLMDREDAAELIAEIAEGNLTDWAYHKLEQLNLIPVVDLH